MARLTLLVRRLGRFLSRRYADARARRGEPALSADGAWARASLDDISGLLSVLPELSDTSQVRLRHEMGSLTVPLEQLDGHPHRLVLGAIERYGTTTPLRTGTWRLEALTPRGWRPMLGRDGAKGTVTDAAAAVTYRLVSTPSGLLVRSVARPRFDQRWKPVHRYRAWRLPRRAATRPLERAVVYECFGGRQVGGNPKALIEPIRERLSGISEYWVIDPGHTYAPAGMKPLVRWTPEWYTRLASAELVVTNAALADHFRRRDGQTVLQTWHGTPLKRLGLDMLSFKHMSPDYAETLRTSSKQWSLLMAPSPLCSEVYPEAFDYDGPLIESGSPRNDVLVAGKDPALVADIRNRLHIEPEQQVVLVAPTFRDGRHRSGDSAATGLANLDRLSDALGNQVTVLFRAHNWIDAATVPVERSNLINASDYPDIADLYLVADVLVTDYSSVMFDFAVTGRPIVFHAPDLEHYRDELRGWYFDLEAEAPGPITRSDDALAEAVTDALARGTPPDFADRYRAFTERFNRWDAAMPAREWPMRWSTPPGGTATPRLEVTHSP